MELHYILIALYCSVCFLGGYGVRYILEHFKKEDGILLINEDENATSWGLHVNMDIQDVPKKHKITLLVRKARISK